MTFPGQSPLLRRLALSVVLLGVMGSPSDLQAQLRTYEPVQWQSLFGDEPIIGEAGGRVLFDQRASLAGVRGTLLEAGVTTLSFRTGRVSITASGTVYRRLTGLRTDREPAPGTNEPGEELSDVGDFLLTTAVLLPLPSGFPVDLALHFGTRLPTTDNRVGLERDRIDFLATLGGRYAMSRVTASAELGVGIDGTREADFEQSDLLVYSARIEGSGASDWNVRPAVQIAGHADGLPGRSIRGNEELSELRAEMLAGNRVTARITGIVGLTEFSPSWGMGIAMGFGM